MSHTYQSSWFFKDTMPNKVRSLSWYKMAQQLMALILNIPYLQPSHFCCTILIFSAFLQDCHIPAGAGSGLLDSLPTRPGAFPGAYKTPWKAVVNAFQICGQEELDPTVLFFFSASGWIEELFTASLTTVFSSLSWPPLYISRKGITSRCNFFQCWNCIYFTGIALHLSGGRGTKQFILAALNVLRLAVLRHSRLVTQGKFRAY